MLLTSESSQAAQLRTPVPGGSNMPNPGLHAQGRSFNGDALTETQPLDPANKYCELLFEESRGFCQLRVKASSHSSVMSLCLSNASAALLLAAYKPCRYRKISSELPMWLQLFLAGLSESRRRPFPEVNPQQQVRVRENPHPFA